MIQPQDGFDIQFFVVHIGFGVVHCAVLPIFQIGVLDNSRMSESLNEMHT
jgi:hypothetical protein